MRNVHSRYATPFFTGTLSLLAVVGCATQDTTDDQSDDSGDVTTTQVCNGGTFVCKSQLVTSTHGRFQPFATPSGFGPADLTSAYKLNASITSTATIAIVDAFNYANAASDLASYRSQFGLPACTVASGCLTIINQTGATSPLPAAPPSGDDWNL
jgi:hypothetical protein